MIPPRSSLYITFVHRSRRHVKDRDDRRMLLAMSADEQRKKNPLGPTGKTVANNVKRLREKHGLEYTQLADRLAALKRPIPTLGLRRVEAGDRRVDADDLVALAIALGTNPNALLLPPSADAEHVLTVTAAGMRPAWQVWKWARGEFPLTYPQQVPEGVPEQNRGAYAQAYFESNADPAMQDWTRSPNISIVTAGDDDGDDQ